MQRDLRVLALGLAVAVTACAHHAATTGSDSEAKPGVGSVRVHVVNHYQIQMEILVTGSGTAHRLGLVAPGIERDFELPSVVVVGGAVTFRAQPSGFGPLYESEEVRIRAGDIVDLQIATNLLGSRATVRMQR
ncbi:MAG: hypothetical protein ACHQU1_05625 [Gemmatimonadales bacterium]